MNKILNPKPTPLRALKPYENNPRKIRPSDVEKLAQSLKEYGWQSVIIANKKGVVINGHTRLAAAQLIAKKGEKIPGWADSNTAPAVLADLTPEQEKALRIADNRLGELTQWDLSRLAEEMKDLTDLDVFTALTETEIHGLFAEAVPLADANAGINEPRKSRPPIGYYGGKQQLSAIILEWAESVKTPWDTWCEPYAGGAACAFALPEARVKSVIINDANDNVVAFWRHLQDPAKLKKLGKLIDERRLIAEAIRDQAIATFQDPAAPPIEKAWALAYLSFVSVGKQILLQKKRIGLDITHYKPAELERIKNFATERMQKFIVTHRDALDVLRVARKGGVFYFIDTPYINSEQAHYGGFTAADFQNCLDELKNFGADCPFILTTYENDQIKTAIEQNGWYLLKIRIRSLASTKAQKDEPIKTKGAKKSIQTMREEWVVSNQPPPNTLLGDKARQEAKRAPNTKPSARKKGKIAKNPV